MDSPTTYVPSLKWRQAEYQALYRLHEPIKDRIVPLINVPPLEWDFEEKKLKKTVQEHIETFPNRLSRKWGGRSALIDFDSSLHDEYMDGGDHVVTFVFDELRTLKQNVVPVTGLSRSRNYQARVKTAQQKCECGIAVRLSFEELMDGATPMNVTNLIAQHDVVPEDVDLIIDLGTPKSFEPYEEFAKALAKRIIAISSMHSFRSQSVLATSINISEVSAPGAVVPRHEWALYKSLRTHCKGVKTPRFGDYCIEPPGYTQMDMRFVNAAGKIIYTTDDDWLIRKGAAFRGNEQQMIQHCRQIVASGHFKDKKYSWGDDLIDKTAGGLECSKSRTTWKQVGFSHHITFVVNQLSTFHDA